MPPCPWDLRQHIGNRFPVRRLAVDVGGREREGEGPGTETFTVTDPSISALHRSTQLYAELAAASSAEMRGRAVAAPKLRAVAGAGSAGLRACQSVTD